jgi:hypothetical protein
MDYAKLDPGLQMALAQESTGAGRVLDVFVQTRDDPGPDAMEFLQRIGVRNVRPNRKVFTAQLTAEKLDELSEQPWVMALTLSTPLRTLG